MASKCKGGQAVGKQWASIGHCTNSTCFGVCIECQMYMLHTLAVALLTLRIPLPTLRNPELTLVSHDCTCISAASSYARSRYVSAAWRIRRGWPARSYTQSRHRVGKRLSLTLGPCRYHTTTTQPHNHTTTNTTLTTLTILTILITLITLIILIILTITTVLLNLLHLLDHSRFLPRRLYTFFSF